jgi:hypothetical protein
MFACLWAVPLAVVLLVGGTAYTQGLTGQIGGSVQDPSGAAVPGADIVLENADTSQQLRKAISDSAGGFVFTELLPGRYNVVVSAKGFKRYREDGIVLTATNRDVLRPIVLEIGSVTDKDTVAGAAPQVETQSSERTGLISSDQVTGLPTIGRSWQSLLNLVPGVTNTNTLDTPDSGTFDTVHINGSRQQTVSLLLDGVPSMDTGNQSGTPMSPSLESIAEVKVLTSNYQAEYGKANGGLVMVVSKAGTADFHGGAYEFFRNEDLNANNFFNNKDGSPRPLYRYNMVGYYLGGPTYIPKVFPRRDKLFFFFAQEFLPTSSPSGLIFKTVPTQLERQGNFSQSVYANGALIPITDPTTGTQFPGNIIPQARFYTPGQALLDYFPQPSAVDPARQYNEIMQDTTTGRYQFQSLRIDYNITQSNQFYTRLNYTIDRSTSPTNGFGDSSWPHLNMTSVTDPRGAVGTWIHTFGPTLVNELTAGVFNNYQNQIIPAASAAANDRSTLGIDIPQFFPANNPYNILPNATFGGVPNAIGLSYESRFPFWGTDTETNFSDNLSKVLGAHNLKAGIYIERTERDAAAWSPLNSLNGSIDFSRSSSNPYDSNYPFSNALLGSISSYSEANEKPVAYDRYRNVEWFIQDNWRATRRLTVDVGVRFYVITPTYQGHDAPMAEYVPSAYNAATAPTLIKPTLNSLGQRVGIDPLTGQLFPSYDIGSLAPGSGESFPGMQVFNGVIERTPPVQIAPRVGFAYDVFGNGKTAVRGGFGMFAGRIADDRTGDFVTEPPVMQLYNYYNTTLQQVAATPPAQALVTPQSVLGIQPTYGVPMTYNYSFGVQQDIGFHTVLSAAYVGSQTHHMMEQIQLNGVPYGAQFAAAATDPTTGQPLPINFLRPLAGLSDVLEEDFMGNANYNALQVQVTRRFASSLTYGFVYTWSKAMDLTQYDQDVLNPFLPLSREYGRSDFDNGQLAVFNFVYDLPSWRANAVTKAVLSHWSVSGIVSFIGGLPQGISYSDTSTSNICGCGGSGVDTRVNIIANPNSKSNGLAFNIAAIAEPALSTFGIGNATKDVFRGPGVNNWDLMLMKTVPLGGDGSRGLQLRFEGYNAFNHTQFNGVDTNALFTNGQQINSDFGHYTSAANPRRMQLAVKFFF